MVDTIDTLNAQLTAVRQAMTDSLNVGASYGKPGFNRTAVSFTDLQTRENLLLRRIDRLANGIAAVIQVGPQQSPSSDSSFLDPDAP